ncbi:MAG: YcxB family protein [Ferruginibacter sp.]
MLIPKVSYSQVIVPIVMLSVTPLLTYFTAKKNYNSNQRISEAIEYQFEKDNLIIKGESFNSQLSWDKIYKVTQTKNWILIWQNSQIANPILKRDIWEGEIESLKVILNGHGVKNNL